MLKPELLEFVHKIFLLFAHRWKGLATGDLVDPGGGLHLVRHLGNGYRRMHQASPVLAVEKN